jgi:molecular chaperone DnaJ
MSKDYYKILGVDKNANQEEIKRAFRKLAHEYHPDKPTGDEAKFKEINEAYQVIGNEEKRKKFDQFGSTFDQQGGFGGGAGWEDFMRQARGGGGFNGANFDFGGGDLGDILGDLFGFGGGGGRSRGTKKHKGDDIEVDVKIELKDAAFGIKKEFELYKNIKCEHCHGNMAEPGTPITTCKNCNGSGVVVQMQRTFIGSFQTQVACPECHGEGKKAEKKCTKCDGQGITKQKEIINVDIPAGVEDGMTLRVHGKGNAGSHGGANGDLFVRIRVKEDERFQRFGDDLLFKEKIDFTQAILGVKLDVETLDGVVELKIPEGTQPNTRFRLKNKGMGHLNSSGRGDMYVEIEVVIPKSVSRKQRQLLEGFDD